MSPDKRSIPSPMPALFIRFWLIALLVIATFIRLHGAGAYYYSADEAMHTSIAGADMLAQVLQFAHYEIHPPVLYILYHYWMMIFHYPASIRALSLVFGLLTILLYYRIGKRMHGELAGMCCAWLIAFSNGCIIQSYVVRHYMILLFFVSLAFYCYLHWRESRRDRHLFYYALFAVIACLTHFSAIFDVACIGAYECFFLWKRRQPRQLMVRWLLMNAVIAAIALYAYHLWQPILVPLKSYFATHVSGSPLSLFTHTLFYPLVTPGYILPSYAAALILLIAQIWIAAARPAFLWDRAGFRFLFTLNIVAYALGMALVLTRLYPEPGTRHSLWVLPFVIVPAGWLLAEAARWLGALLPRAKPYAPPLLLLGMGVVMYNPHDRFHDGSEYVWPGQEWHAFTSYMEKLGPRDLIVTEKDDAIMLTNVYRVMGNDAFTGKTMAAVAPYRDTRILFNPYYPRNYSRFLLLATLQEAESRHMFDGVDRLIFLRMAWSRSPLTDLMLCDPLDKQLITFPSSKAGHVLTRGDLYGSFAVLMIVPKEPFLHNVLSNDTAIHGCLNGAHDSVPDLAPP